MKRPSTSRRLVAATSVLMTLAATSLLSAAPAAAQTESTSGMSIASIVPASTSQCDAAVGQLVTNCGFETGDFSGWTVVRSSETFVGDGVNGTHSGTYNVAIGERNSAMSLSQTVTTTIGRTYYIRFYLDGYDDGGVVSFTATLDNGSPSTLLALSGGSLGHWTARSYSFQAVGSSVTLTFTAQNEISYWYLDDIAVYERVAPTVTLSPINQTVTDGTMATFTAAATGAYTPEVQWQESVDGGSTWANVTQAPATRDTLSVWAWSDMNGFQYRAIYTSDAGTVTAGPATLTVTESVAPMVTSQPGNKSVTAGTTATFTAAASGDPAPTVQWQVSTNGGSTWTNLPAATSDTLSLTASYAMNGNQYHAVYANTAGTATSNAATLSVSFGPARITALTAVSSKGTITVNFVGAGDPTPTMFECQLPVGKKLPTWTTCTSGATFKSSAKTVSVHASNTGGESWGATYTVKVTR